MKSKKIISAVAALAIVFAATSCGGRGNDSNMNKITLPNYDEYETEYETVISGWLIPSSLNETNVKWIKEAGVSALFACGAGDVVLSFPTYDQKAKAALDLLGSKEATA
ncbi:unknown [Acidiphilium sp. CAG:727]|nr:unknown [Acidiphilium sp. CAG:727]